MAKANKEFKQLKPPLEGIGEASYMKCGGHPADPGAGPTVGVTPHEGAFNSMRTEARGAKQFIEQIRKRDITQSNVDTVDGKLRKMSNYFDAYRKVFDQYPRNDRLIALEMDVNAANRYWQNVLTRLGMRPQ
jgi:hypothetical protein